MNQLLTANVATHIFWLGRYLERIESTMTHVMQAYDSVIDVNKNAGVELYRKWGIEIEYTDSQSFLNAAIFGDHRANLFDFATMARENAIICRSQIDAEAFGEIIELYAMFEKASKNMFDMNYKCIDIAHSLINEVWGSLSRRKNRQESDYFFRLGKIVEELDFHLRFDGPRDTIDIVIKNIDVIINKLSADNTQNQSRENSLSDADRNNIINLIDSKIAKLIIG